MVYGINRNHIWGRVDLHIVPLPVWSRLEFYLIISYLPAAITLFNFISGPKSELNSFRGPLYWKWSLASRQKHFWLLSWPGRTIRVLHLTTSIRYLIKAYTLHFYENFEVFFVWVEIAFILCWRLSQHTSPLAGHFYILFSVDSYHSRPNRWFPPLSLSKEKKIQKFRQRFKIWKLGNISIGP